MLQLQQYNQYNEEMVEVEGELALIPCFNSRWGDCEGEIEFCPSLGATLCTKHHQRVHEPEHPEIH